MKRIISLILAFGLFAAVPVAPPAEAHLLPGGVLRPFPQEAYFNYAVPRIMPAGFSQAQMNLDVIAQFNRILPGFVVDPATSSAENRGDFRMVLRDEYFYNSFITHSYTMGYGMLMLVYLAGAEEMIISGDTRIKDRLKGNLPAGLQEAFNDVTFKDYFDAMFRALKQFPGITGGSPHGNYLMTWQLGVGSDGFWHTPAVNSSQTDGDMDMAYALVLADKQWGGGEGGTDYLYWAKGMLNQLYKTCVDPGNHHLLMGNWVSGNNRRITRTSDAMFQHMRVFDKVDTVNDWQLVINAAYEAVSHLAHPNTGLLPDYGWLGIDGTWHPLGRSPSDGLNHFNDSLVNDGRYSSYACRVPMRMGLNVFHGGTEIFDELKMLNDSMNSRTAGRFTHIRGGSLDGTALLATGGTEFSAPFLVTAAAYGSAEWMTNGWNWARARGGVRFGDGDGILVLSMIAASGNWWCPAPAEPSPLYGDVNSDGVINSADVTMLKYYIASSDRPKFRADNPTFNFENARVAGGSDVTAADVSLLQLWIATPVNERGSVKLGP
jgi:hypothetical protein